MLRNRLRGWAPARRIGSSPDVFILYGLHGVAAIVIVAWTPLQVGWKGLILASSAAFLVIPPLTWRFLRHTHETEV
jgi:hypothetical protein